MATRSGLMASPQKRIKKRKKFLDLNSLLPCAITRPAQFSLKPFASLYNPYSKGCSVLCNHPNKKKGWPCPTGVQKPTPAYINDLQNVIDIPDHVPEEFFRRYTDQLDTDSRPLTPTPSCATSARTRGGHRDALGGSHLSARRCVTPEPTVNEHEKKQLILDLRKSHSQETLYWNASSEFSHRQDSVTSSMIPQPQLPPQPIKHEIEIIGTSHKEEIDDIQEDEELENLFDEFINDTGDFIEHTSSCINARDDEDEEALRRRGKLRRKKSKTNVQVITFTPSNEPETQVAQIDDLDQDSPNISSRHSLVPDSTATSAITKIVKKNEDFGAKSVFHTDDSLKTLKMGLNVEMVESVFDRYRYRTLQEALRTISIDKLGVESEAVREMKESLNLTESDSEKWQQLPRKFTRASIRFELPIDTREMARLKPFNYLSKYVYIDEDKKQLYHRTFVNFLPKLQPKEETENEDFFNSAINKSKFTENLLSSRVMPIDQLNKALREVLGFHASDSNIAEVLSFLELETLDEDATINFRTFCGIVAFSERLITNLSQEDDPRDEIEIADFETLGARHIHKIESELMRKMLEIVQK